jgi:hypothetical protein
MLDRPGGLLARKSVPKISRTKKCRGSAYHFIGYHGDKLKRANAFSRERKNRGRCETMAPLHLQRVATVVGTSNQCPLYPKKQTFELSA